MIAKRQLAEFVCDAVNLEGLNFSLPEIQTLLDGVTVGGHKLSDQQNPKLVTINERVKFYKASWYAFLILSISCSLLLIQSKSQIL